MFRITSTQFDLSNHFCKSLKLSDVFQNAQSGNFRKKIRSRVIHLGTIFAFFSCQDKYFLLSKSWIYCGRFAASERSKTAISQRTVLLKVNSRSDWLSKKGCLAWNRLAKKVNSRSDWLSKRGYLAYFALTKTSAF